MKAVSSELTRLTLLLCLAPWLITPRTAAQTSAGLEIQLYAGLTIRGTVGTVYSIDYVSDMAQTNDASAWRCLEYLQLPASPYSWMDKSAPAVGRRFYRAVAMEVPASMVFIPPGTFRMGSPTNEVGRAPWESPRMAVTISRGFWMGKYELTQREYSALMGSNPSGFSDPERPVERVTWHDATNFCARLTEQERAAGRIAINSLYRLPTEAEWEYACRAWTSTRLSFGDSLDYTELAKYAWNLVNSGDQTHPVGQKLPNPWGLYDMHGNVWEWCQDWLDTYPGGLVVDPRGPPAGWERVIRGGGWQDPCGFGRDCRSALRFSTPPALRNSSVGFRAVLAPADP